MSEISVIGCGGIGSYFAQHIDRLIDLEQLDKDMHFTFYDDDTVEMKNMLYQNFETSDIENFKADALSLRYFNVEFKNKRLSSDGLELSQSDLIVLCADNNKIRKEAWNNWKEHQVPFIDSRANGKAIGIFSNETENYLDTITEDEKESSCQNPFQLAKKEIEYGNIVVASVLAQTVLNYSRRKRLPTDFMITF